MAKFSRNKNLKSVAYKNGKAYYFSSTHEKLAFEALSVGITGNPVPDGSNNVTRKFHVEIASNDNLNFGNVLYYTGTYAATTDEDYYGFVPVVRALNDADSSGVTREGLVLAGVYNGSVISGSEHNPEDLVEIIVEGVAELRVTDSYYMHDGAGVAFNATFSTTTGSYVVGPQKKGTLLAPTWRVNIEDGATGQWHSATIKAGVALISQQATPTEAAPAGGGNL
jgi:hypothetical protein